MKRFKTTVISLLITCMALPSVVMADEINTENEELNSEETIEEVVAEEEVVPEGEEADAEEVASDDEIAEEVTDKEDSSEEEIIPSEDIENIISNEEDVDEVIVTPTIVPEVTEAPAEVLADSVPVNVPLKTYVTRLYKYALNRTCSDSECDYWVNKLTSGKETAVGITTKFIFGNECKNRNLSNIEFVKVLYETVLWRTADAGEVSYWASKLDSDSVTREDVYNKFISTPAFTNNCGALGIPTGIEEEIVVVPTPTEIVKKFTVETYVNDLYVTCMGKVTSDSDLNYWVDKLSSKKSTVVSAVQAFMKSSYCTSTYKTTEDTVKLYYAVLLHREPTSKELSDAVKTINDTVHTKEYVFATIVASEEFTKFCESIDCVPGTYATTHACDLNVDVANFVERVYKGVMGRKSDVAGLDYWVSKLVTFEKSPQEMIWAFIHGSEFSTKNATDEAYVTALYKTCLGRNPDAAGMNYWLNKLADTKYTRDDMLSNMLYSKEFLKLTDSVNLYESNMVQVAKTQIGEKGGLKYCKWYGYNYRIEWCACFVSWVAEQCGYIKTGIVPKYKWCLDAKAWFMARNQWVSNRNYVPKSGDIIFFDWNGNGVIDHTGIVVGVEANGRIHTIEGNKDDEVRTDRVLFVGDKDICGYGVPNYPAYF